jgi:dipeptidyl aminopeptidase/acylaminoacyl peptidase
LLYIQPVKILRMLTRLLFVFLLAANISYAQTETQLIKVTDLLQIKNISSINLNNDGTKVLFTITAIEPEADSKWEYKYITQLWMAVTDGSQPPRQLTFSKEGASQPVWSPDGKQIVFVRAADGKAQLFLLPLDGGEPVQLTKSKYGANNPRWSSDGKQLVFTSTVSLKEITEDSALNKGTKTPAWAFEKPGFVANENLLANTAKANPDGNMQEVRAYLEQNEKDKKAKVLNKLNFQQEATTSAELNFTHVFVIDAKVDASIKPVTTGFFSFNNARFAGNSNQLIVETEINETQHPDRVLEGGIYSIQLNGTRLKKILDKKEKKYTSASVSPGGKWLAFQQGGVSFVSVPALAVMPVNGTENDIIEIPFDRNKSNLTWSEDEKYLYFTSPSNGGNVLSRVNMKTKKIEQLTSPDEGVNTFDVKGNKLVYVKTNIQTPFEVYTASTNAKNEKQLTRFNTNWIKDKKLSLPEKHSFKNEKGHTIEYWVMKPTNFEAGKKYPVVLEIHGGPSAMWGPGESSMWHEFQYFCSKGYGVVYCNPRGSGGYGIEHLRGNINDWGAGPTSDVLTSLNKTIAEGWADTSKLVVTGGSYAGYLVAWIISHDNRFKAACSQRGVYDFSTFFGEGNAWRLIPNYFGGYPFNDSTKKIIERESPINYVQNITTPYIIFHGENDLRTGVIQSEMMYRSLKVLERPVEYVRHPGATHEITRSGNNRQRIDQMLRTWEFFERYIHTK